MRNHRSALVIFGLTAIASLLLGACAPQVVTVTQVFRETVVVPSEVEAFTTPHPILSDIRVRQAIAFCTDRVALVNSVYAFVEDKEGLLMDSFIPTDHWAHAAGLTQYAFDAEQGGTLLDEAGWTLAEGAAVRTNADGEALSLHFATTNAQFRQTWAAVFEANMADCGIQVVRLHAPASWWFGDTTGLARRDFELGAFAWVGQADPGGVTLYSCDSIPLPSNNWEGQNYMGWCNESASTAIKAANNTLDRQERIDNYAIVQQEFANDMVSLPVFNRAEFLATNLNLSGFAPAPGEAYTCYNLHTWELSGSDTIILGYTQEPASLFTLVEDAFVASNAACVIFGRQVSSLNYDYQANMYFDELPTLENGGAVLNVVDVADGDVVVNADGDVGPLASGMSIKDGEGNIVEYTGGGAQMQQMVLTWTLSEGITWQDGEPLKAADLDLGYQISCDPDSGATDFTVCDRTVSVENTDSTSTVTLVPGYTPPTYFTINYGWYPSHQVLSDGRVLADVPASEWTTLPEIAESPLSTGPYMITAWEKGQSMTFEANPEFYLGAPTTPNVVIKFVVDTNQAVAQLLTGEVDVLFAETLGAGAEVQTAKEAADAGQITFYSQPSATWEHIDFNLFTK
jgi:ABC-type transport system substrate-binding protein